MLKLKGSQNDKDKKTDQRRKKGNNDKGWFIAFFDVELSLVRVGIEEPYILSY